MSNIVIIGDLHFGSRNLNLTIYEEQKKFLNEEFFPYLLENNIKHVICLGDILDKRTNIDFLVLRFLNEEFFNFFNEHKINFYNIIGNHDLYYKNTDSLSGINELTSYKSKYINIINYPEMLTFDNKNFYCVPWITDENKEEYLTKIHENENKDTYLLGHFELIGFVLYKDTLSEHGSIETSELYNYKWTYSGHYHIGSEDVDKKITYIGTPYDLNWADADDKKKFLVYDTETDTFNYVYTKNKLYVKVIYNEDLVDNFPYLRYENKHVKIFIYRCTDENKLVKFVDNINKIKTYSIQFVDYRDSNEEEIINGTYDNMNPLQIISEMVDNDVKDNDMNLIMKNISREIYDKAIAMTNG